MGDLENRKQKFEQPGERAVKTGGNRVLHHS